MLTADRDLVLRPIEHHDLDFVVALRNDLTIERLAGTQPPRPRLRAEFETNMNDPNRRSAVSDGTANSVEFLCEISSARAGIGGLYGIDVYARHAELGVSLADGPWRGKGYGELAHRRLIEYAFQDLNLRRVLASVHADNANVLALCRRLGFVQDGVRKEFRWVAGNYVDLVLLSMDREDYEAAQRVGTPQ